MVLEYYFLLFLFNNEFYAFQAVKTLVRVKWGLVLYQVVSAVVLLFIVYSLQNDSSVGQTQQTMLRWITFACICSKNCFASFHVR
jgi:hypothetical protein